MSLESIIERVAISAEHSELLLAKVLTALEDLTEAVYNMHDNAKPTMTYGPLPVPPPAPLPAGFGPKQENPVPTVPVTPTVPAASGAPFTDQAGLMTYVMEKYKALGPTKGAMIQSKLLELGCANIKALPIEKYGDFHAAVEAL